MDLLKADIALGTPNTALNSLTPDGTVRVGWDGKSKLRIEHDLSGSGDWAPIFDGLPPEGAPAINVDYLGTALRISNLGPAASTKVRVGEGE